MSHLHQGRIYTQSCLHGDGSCLHGDGARLHGDGVRLHEGPFCTRDALEPRCVCTGAEHVCTRVVFARGWVTLVPGLCSRAVVLAPGLCLHRDRSCLPLVVFAKGQCSFTPEWCLHKDGSRLHQGHACTGTGRSCTSIRDCTRVAHGRVVFARGGGRRTDPFAPGPGLHRGCVCAPGLLHGALCTGPLHGAGSRCSALPVPALSVVLPRAAPPPARRGRPPGVTGLAAVSRLQG